MKILFEIAFVGSGYNGYQVQPRIKTVQGEVQKALESMFGVKLSVSGCSRTDAGVHARQFFITAEGKYDKNSLPPTGAMPRIASRFFPSDIAMKSAYIVPDDFHVRHDVLYKEYEYLINNSGLHDPFTEKRSWFYPIKLDETIMNEAAQALVGSHDFKAYMASGSDIKDTTREIKYISVARQGDYVKINVAADGFLYNMVRIIVGTLVDVSAGRIPPFDIDRITKAKKRGEAGQTAPPEGLYLNKVVYTKDYRGFNKIE